MENIQTANSFNLGRAFKEYKKASGSAVKVIIVMVICAVIAAVLFFVPFLENQIDYVQVTVLWIVGLMVLVPFFVGAYSFWQGRGAILTLYENGLSYRRGRKNSTAVWDEIAFLTQGLTCRIETKNSEIIEFGSNIAGFGEIAKKIENKTYQTLLPSIEAAISRGESVHFKTLKADKNKFFSRLLNRTIFAGEGFTVDAQGITDNDEKKQIAWSEIVNFGVGNVEGNRFVAFAFFVQSVNDTFAKDYSRLANAGILLGICEEMVHAKKNEEAPLANLSVKTNDSFSKERI